MDEECSENVVYTTNEIQHEKYDVKDRKVNCQSSSNGCYKLSNVGFGNKNIYYAPKSLFLPLKYLNEQFYLSLAIFTIFLIIGYRELIWRGLAIYSFFFEKSYYKNCA